MRFGYRSAYSRQERSLPESVQRIPGGDRDTSERQIPVDIKEIELKYRLIAGGLPMFPNYEITNREVRELSGRFKVIAVSKLQVPDALKMERGNICFCFVNLENAKDVRKAIEEVNGVFRWHWAISVNDAHGHAGTFKKLPRLFKGNLPEFSNQMGLEEKVKSLSRSFDIISISPLFSPPKSKRNRQGCRHYCFIELANRTQVAMAIKARNGISMWGAKNIRVDQGVSNKQW